MSIPNNTIGYGAIIMPHIDTYQGFYLVDDPTRRGMVTKMMAMAIASGRNALATLEAVMADGYLTGREDVVSIAAQAYAGLSKDNFFYVIAQKVSGGINTEAKTFEATTLSDCRKELENLPEVMRIKARITEKLLHEKRH